MAVTKKQLTNLLYQRLSGTIAKKHLNSAITVICEFLLEKLIANQAVSVENFGTFSPYTQPSHMGFNVAKGRLQQVKAFLTVRFRPHVAFVKMVRQWRDKYQKP
jgi:nucleoid DNA-binding protein